MALARIVIALSLVLCVIPAQELRAVARKTAATTLYPGAAQGFF